ncbi:hypothetical protein Tco_0152547 [Tanacetum coccineum]
MLSRYISMRQSFPKTSLQQPVVEIKPQQLEEPKPTLENECKDLHLNLLVLEVLVHAPIYNSILDKYVKSLELGKNGSAFVQGETPAKMGDSGLFTLPCRLGDSKPFDTLADLGSCIEIGTPKAFAFRKRIPMLPPKQLLIVGWPNSVVTGITRSAGDRRLQLQSVASHNEYQDGVTRSYDGVIVHDLAYPSGGLLVMDVQLGL